MNPSRRLHGTAKLQEQMEIAGIPRCEHCLLRHEDQSIFRCRKCSRALCELLLEPDERAQGFGHITSVFVNKYGHKGLCGPVVKEKSIIHQPKAPESFTMDELIERKVITHAEAEGYDIKRPEKFKKEFGDKR